MTDPCDTARPEARREDARARAWRCAALAAAMLLGLAAPARAGEAPTRTIRVVMDDNYPPFVFAAPDGRLQGILIDQWRLWEKQTGIKAELHAMDWGEALRRMRDGEFDVIDTIFATRERRTFLDFTPPYAHIEVPIFFRKDISGIIDLESLRGFPVAAKEGDYAVTRLHEAGVMNVLLFANYEAIVAAAREGRINVFVVDAPPAFYFLNKLGIASEFRHTPPVYVGQFHRAARKGDTAVRRAVTEGFAALDPAALKRIDEKWFGRDVGGARYLAYAGYAAAGAAAVLVALLGWNRALRRVVAHRTAALRESEERFRQVVENIQEVFWMSDVAKNQVIYVSRGYEKIWGRTCASLYESPRSWLEGIHPEDRERVLLAATTKQAAGQYDEVYRVLRPDGVVRWVRDQAFPVKDERGAVVRVVGVAEDITERKQLEEQFLRAQRQEAIGTLASGIAHDLNNILTPVLLSSALLRHGAKSAHEQELLQMLEGNARRGAELIRQLLIFSRGTDVPRTRVALPKLFAEVAAIARETFPRDIALRVETPADAPPVLADATQLHQVLLNLCVNARDAMPDGGTLTLRLEASDLDAEAARAHPGAAPGRYLVASVADTGRGIAPEIVGRIFEPFFTTKDVGRGSGLGLSTVLGIVKSHGGFVTVQSEAGRGSAFRVHLPAAPAGEGEAPVPTADALPAGDGELILVVDDEDIVQRTTRAVLERHRYRVLAAADGEQALALFIEHQGEVRLVVTDVMMPVMGGPALVRALRTLHPDVRVVAVTGMASDARHEELAALGVATVLQKPYEARDLLGAIRRELAPPC